jgi:glucokinase
VHVGATLASFGLAYARGRVDWVRSLPCAEYTQCAHAALDYLYMCQCEQVRHVVLAFDDMVVHPWSAAIEEMRQRLSLDTLLIVNEVLAAPAMNNAAARLDAQLAPQAASSRVRRWWHGGRRHTHTRNAHASQ